MDSDLQSPYNFLMNLKVPYTSIAKLLLLSALLILTGALPATSFAADKTEFVAPQPEPKSDISQSTIAQVATSETVFCENYQQPKNFQKIQADIDKKIEQFANKKVIATLADLTLTKLLEAKSPVIITWLKKRNLTDKSEEEIVKAWRLYYARTFVLMSYPQENTATNLETEKLVDDILKTTLTKSFRNRLERLFKRSKTAAISAVQKMNIPIRTKDKIIARLKTTKLYWPKDLKSARNNAIPLDLIQWGIAYDPVPNEINIGVQALSYPNDETYLAVFAHEMGHTIDACRWGAFFVGPWAFDKVGECLRSDKSVAAKRRDDGPLDKMLAEGKVKENFVQMMKSNPTCNKLVYPPPGVQADQLNESFADWFSTEVMAQMKNIKVSKMRLDLCEEKTLIEGSSYPSNKDRLSLIYQAHPAFKAKQTLSDHYCEL